MLQDIFTIMWKEAREIAVQRPNMRGGWLGMLVFIGVFGVLIPLQTGPSWISSPATMLMWSWVPFILVNSIVADSFAGERERHTLETLLASRLSDRAILFGKLAAAVAYGWGLALISLLLGVIAINIAHGSGGFLFFSPGAAAGILALTFLVAAFAGTLGILVSLRASSVRQAQQTLSMAMFVVLIPLLALPLLPESAQANLVRFLAGLDMTAIVTGGVVLLLAADILLLVLAMLRFQRARLILD